MSIESDNTVRNVQQILAFDADHGTEKAYETLRRDYERYASTHGGFQSGASHAYWDSVSSGLRKDALPDLAVVWGQQNRDNFRGGEIESADLKTVPHLRTTDLDRTMSAHLLGQFDTLKTVHRDRVQGGDEKNALTKGDLDDRIGQIDAARQQTLDQKFQDAKSRDLMFQLTASSSGNQESTLFSRLGNKDHSWEHKVASAFGSTPAGSIGEKELTQSVNDFDRRKQLGEISQLPSEMRNRVEADAATARYLKENWDKPEVLKLRSFVERDEANGRAGGEHHWVKHYGAITPESLAAAGGFNSLKDMVSRYKGSESFRAADMQQHLAPSDSTASGVARDYTGVPVKPYGSTDQHTKILIPPADQSATASGVLRDGSGNVVRDSSGQPVRTGEALPPAVQVMRDRQPDAHEVRPPAPVADPRRLPTQPDAQDVKPLPADKNPCPDDIHRHLRSPQTDQLRARALMYGLMNDSIQNVGEGPWQAAARLLPGASNSEVMQLTQSLKKSYQTMNNDHTDALKSLEPGYQWLNTQNLKQIMELNPALQLRFKALMVRPDLER